jgi:hypothetical protein
MSQTSVSTASRRAVRVAVAAVVAVALLAPAAYLFTRVWSDNTTTFEFNRAERRGVAYLGPLTDLLSVITRAQSAAVRTDPPDLASIRKAVAAVDEVDGRLGGQLRTTERWTAIRQTVIDRASRSWPDPSSAYEQYSDLVTTLTALTRKVGDVSNLILDPQLDTYYVMNATLLRIPEIIVDSGRYLDLSVLSTGRTDPESTALLAAARNRIASDATDLADGLVKAFGATGSGTLGPGLTSQLDDFRTAVDAVAPSTSLLAPPPQRTPTALATGQAGLERAALALQKAGLIELDRLLAPRERAASTTRVLGTVAIAVIAVMVIGAALGFVLLLPDSAAGTDPYGEDVSPAARAPDRDLVGTGPPGGAHVPR